MKEHRKMFTGQSVPQIMAGTKTMTRRVITRRNSYFDGHRWPKDLEGELLWDEAFVDPGPSPIGNPGPYLQLPRVDGRERCVHRIYPRVQVGDRFWVKESWRTLKTSDSCRPRDLKVNAPVQYKADGYCADFDCDFSSARMGKWRSPLYMPRWMSRLTLEVAENVVERVQDISEEDAIWEGCRMRILSMPNGANGEATTAKHAFAMLWDSKNLKRGHGWHKNEWVFGYRFKVVENEEM